MIWSGGIARVFLRQQQSVCADRFILWITGCKDTVQQNGAVRHRFLCFLGGFLVSIASFFFLLISHSHLQSVLHSPPPYCCRRYIGGCSHACISQPPTWLTPLEILYPTKVWIRIYCFMVFFPNPSPPLPFFPPRGEEGHGWCMRRLWYSSMQSGGINGQANRKECKDRWMDGWADGPMDEAVVAQPLGTTVR